MPDREKVINELVSCIENALSVDSDYVDCIPTDLLQYAVALLKEQEPRVMTFEETNRRANEEAQEITEYISKKEAVTRIGDLLILQLKGKRLPTWNEVYHAIND